jgi:carbamoyltransferase
LDAAVYVLGISAFYHDSAAALVRDGEIVAAAQEERFTRNKHDLSLPVHATRYCLDEAGISLDQVDYVAFYEKPILTFDRLLETYMAFAPRGLPSFIKAIPLWVKEKIFQKSLIKDGLNDLNLGKVPDNKIVFGFHHQSHAASAFYASPFEEAAVLIADGVGEWATTSLGHGKGNMVELTDEIRFPHSLGMLYSAFTYYLGFKVNDGEYKMMGLAPYGQPKYADLILDKLMDLKPDGSFKLKMDYFNYCTGLTMTNVKFGGLFGAPPRPPESLLTQRDMDLASSVQLVTEEIMLRLAKTLHQRTGSRNLCIAGGVGLNCVANGRILREGPFDNVWIQPASGDAGAAVGVALDACFKLNGELPRSPQGRDAMKGCYLGPSFDNQAVRKALAARGAAFEEMAEAALIDAVATALADGKVVGWFQGRMEFGPRALGNRSILGDARSASMQRVLNMKVKYRESFRPFAPIVLRQDVAEYFELDRDSPYMMLVAPVKESRRLSASAEDQMAFGLDKLNQLRSDLPAITHVDYSARIQTVDGRENPRMYKLLEAFKAKTGYGVLVNTSFNVRDEPIVCTPDDAYRCFMGTEMDILVVENMLLFKERQ